MRARPISPDLLVREWTEAIAALPSPVRVAVDGAPGTNTGQWADALVDPLRVRGHRVIRVRMSDYLRPASLRWEHGRHDPDSYYSEWFDHNGLMREVLRPLEPGGSGLVLPALRDPDTGRSPRLPRQPLSHPGAVVVDGPLLLGAGLPFDHALHLWLSESALARRIPEDLRWALPALHRYATEVRPERTAHQVARVDHPDRIAVIDAFD